MCYDCHMNDKWFEWTHIIEDECGWHILWIGFFKIGVKIRWPI